MNTQTRIEQLMAVVPPLSRSEIAQRAIITVIEQRINSHRPGGYIGSREMAEQIYRGVQIAFWGSGFGSVTDEQLRFVEDITDQIMREMSKSRTSA